MHKRDKKINLQHFQKKINASVQKWSDSRRQKNEESEIVPSNRSFISSDISFNTSVNVKSVKRPEFFVSTRIREYSPLNSNYNSRTNHRSVSIAERKYAEVKSKYQQPRLQPETMPDTSGHSLRVSARSSTERVSTNFNRPGRNITPTRNTGHIESKKSPLL